MNTTIEVLKSRRAAPATPPLALLGGRPAVTASERDLFTCPIIIREDEAAVLDVLRRRDMSGTSITMEFEKKFAAWMGVRFALAVNSGTSSLLGAPEDVGGWSIFKATGP